jgi:hypothetical protein
MPGRLNTFAPYVVIAIPLMLKTFLHSYRIRLKQFRKVHNIIAILIIGMLALNVIFTFDTFTFSFSFKCATAI